MEVHKPAVFTKASRGRDIQLQGESTLLLTNRYRMSVRCPLIDRIWFQKATMAMAEMCDVTIAMSVFNIQSMVERSLA